MTAASVSVETEGECWMRTRRLARFRAEAVTPGTRDSADSTRVTQAAQVTPSTS